MTSLLELYANHCVISVWQASVLFVFFLQKIRSCTSLFTHGVWVLPLISSCSSNLSVSMLKCDWRPHVGGLSPPPPSYVLAVYSLDCLLFLLGLNPSNHNLEQHCVSQQKKSLTRIPLDYILLLTNPFTENYKLAPHLAGNIWVMSVEQLSLCLAESQRCHFGFNSIFYGCGDTLWTEMRNTVSNIAHDTNQSSCPSLIWL